MKNFKRVVAALLLGAMMMTLMAGCCSNYKEERVLEAIKIYTNNDEITLDADLQKDAEYVTSVFARSENLESDRKEDCIAYAKVSLEDERFWEIMKKSNDDDATSWTGPVWYDKSREVVNAGLYLPYSDNVVSLIRNMKYLNGVKGCLTGKTKVGISIVNVKGDDYVVIVATE